MLEPGFIWYLIKSIRFPVLVFAWTYCVAYTFNPSSPEGIEKNILRAVDEIVKLPMTNNFDSYNVSVAAGMILYEAMRQRLF